MTPDDAEAFASAKLAHLVLLLSTGPGDPEPKPGVWVREHGDDLHWFVLSMGADNDGLRPFQLSFGTQTGPGENMTIHGELRAWWNPALPEPAGLASVESCILAPPPVTLAAFCDEAARYVKMDLPPWEGPLTAALYANITESAQGTPN
jgi:hypothetical protein